MILETRNNLFQLFDTLKRNRTKRHREKLCFVESVKAIKVAVENNWQIKYACIPDGKKLSSWSEELIASIPNESVISLSQELFDELTDKENGSEIFVILATNEQSLERVSLPDNFKIVLLDNPHSPGNLGTIIRTADALGFHAVLTVGHSVDIFDPKTIRASLGACFSIPSISLSSPSEIANWTASAERPVRIIGTSANAKRGLADTNFQGNVILAFGNETNGLGKGLRPLCDELISIPISGVASSLNLSAAAAIIMYQASLQNQEIV